MRVMIAVGWLMLPVLAGAYHYGPGQEQLRSDRAALALRLAERCAASDQWSDAVANYDIALSELPEGMTEQTRSIRLERAKARLKARKLAEAHADLKSLLAELEGDAKADARLLSETRRTLANAQYYNTWLMRLEGEPSDVWEPEIEAARQNYRLLAENADAAGDKTLANGCREDLEAAVRLARMSLSDLQALSLPSQCQGCCSCSGKGKGLGSKMRANDVRGASSGPPPDNSGH